MLIKIILKKELRFFKTNKLISRDFLKEYHSPHTSIFLKKNVFKKFGLYNEELKIASDFEFMLRIFGVKRIKSKYINKTILVMRAGGTSTKSLMNIMISNYEVYKAFKINNLRISVFLILRKILRKISQIKF